MTLSPALAEALAARRGRFNARVAAMRHERQGFDTDAFAEAVRDRLDPLVAAVAQAAPDRVAAVVAAAFDMALLLVARGLLGPRARGDVANRVWSDLGPVYAAPIAAAPRVCLGALTNASLRLSATPGVRVDDWLALMAKLARFAMSVEPRTLALIAAWRAGAAHYREAALAAADEVPEAVALTALGTSDATWTDIREQLAANRWWTPDGTVPDRGVEVGAFTGFGGLFDRPPEVRAAPEGFHVRSGERHFLLVADAFGVTLHPASADAFDAADAPCSFPALRGSALETDDRHVAFDLPAQGLAAPANADTIAVTSPFTHAIRLLPRVRP